MNQIDKMDWTHGNILVKTTCHAYQFNALENPTENLYHQGTPSTFPAQVLSWWSIPGHPQKNSFYKSTQALKLASELSSHRRLFLVSRLSNMLVTRVNFEKVKCWIAQLRLKMNSVPIDGTLEAVSWAVWLYCRPHSVIPLSFVLLWRKRGGYEF